MDNIDAILDKILHYYNKRTDSNLYGVLKAFSDEFDIAYASYINRADSAIGIDDTFGIDLDWRWGALLNIARNVGESDNDYRTRLALMVQTLHGGTAESLHYAVSLFLGIAPNTDKADRSVMIYDGWKYPNAPDQMKAKGNVICKLHFDVEDRLKYYDGVDTDIINVVKNVKTSGVMFNVVFEYNTHAVLSKYTHQQLSAHTHDQLRKWGIS